MNDQLQEFARDELKKGLAQLSVEQQLLFKRMYSHKDLALPITEVVDNMPEERLDRAMQQVRRALEKP